MSTTEQPDETSQANLTGSGAIASGDNNSAAGNGAVIVQRDVKGDVVTGSKITHLTIDANLAGVFQVLWPLVVGLCGAALLAYCFDQLWMGAQAILPYLGAGGGWAIVAFALGWVGFKQVRCEPGTPGQETTWAYPQAYRLGRAGLAAAILALLIGAPLLAAQQEQQKQKLIVIITRFENPGKDYGLYNKMIDELNDAFAGNEAVEILPIQEDVTPERAASMRAHWANAIWRIW